LNAFLLSVGIVRIHGLYATETKTSAHKRKNE